ncbi:MAG TPA: TIGR03668 family PPOX class F420-dependent oxidoreductase [Candidatus Dormibacteraeota bacterium]
MTEDEARSRFETARVARLATVDGRGRPHVVPVTFDARGDSIVIAVDHKPKRTTDLKRLRNIRGNPHVSVLVDHYEDDWTALWWVRADGTARVVEDEGERAERVRRLQSRYRQYRDVVPAGPVISITVTAWTGWSYSQVT